MSCKTVVGLLVSGLLVGAAAMAGGCSSSKGTQVASSDAGGSDGSVVHADSGSGVDSGVDSEAPTYDGTSGKPCSTDADCRTNPAGPGKNFCSTDARFGASGGDTVYPNGVCVYGQGDCNSGSDGLIHYCDGPDQYGSPGVCLPSSSDPTKGACFPMCTFKPDGSAVIGLVGKNACFAYGFIPDPSEPSNAAIGVGYSLGGCDTDADCQTAGQHCQADRGFCVATVIADQPPGTGCNPAASPAPACDCSWKGLGFCKQFCKIGGSECTSSQICDAFLPIELSGTNDAAIPGWTAANPGMAGVCSPRCVVDGGAETDAGTCYTNSTCQAGDFGGPDCLPTD
jgi:hypothetical protein